MKFANKFLSESRGSSLIEVALILPVMVFMLIAVVDFGVILHQDLLVADSARSAAGAATTFIWADNTNYIKSVGTSSASGIPGYAIATARYCLCAPGSAQIACTTQSACGTYGIPNQYIQVTATAQLPLLFSIAGFPKTYNVKSVAIARTPWTGTN